MMGRKAHRCATTRRREAARAARPGQHNRNRLAATSPRPAGAAWSSTRPGCGPVSRRLLHLPQALVRRAPAACWWARTAAVSTTCRSRSAPAMRVRFGLERGQHAVLRPPHASVRADSTPCPPGHTVPAGRPRCGQCGACRSGCAGGPRSAVPSGSCPRQERLQTAISCVCQTAASHPTNMRSQTRNVRRSQTRPSGASCAYPARTPRPGVAVCDHASLGAAAVARKSCSQSWLPLDPAGLHSFIKTRRANVGGLAS